MVGNKKAEAAAVVMDEEEAFPRGGGHGLAPVAQKKLEQEAYAEAEAELFGGKKGKKRKSTVTDEQVEDGDAFISSMNLQGKLPKYAELLKFKSLSVGSKLWGAVVEVSPHALVVSLPHGLKGHVSYAQASDVLEELAGKQEKAVTAAGKAAGEENNGKKGGMHHHQPGPLLTELFSIGQLVRCSVVGLEGGEGSSGKKKKIQLSLHVARINQGLGIDGLKEGLALPGCVRSVEDHGYIITFGIKGTSGFLPKKSVPGILHPGSLVEVVVGKVGPGGAATVSCNQEEVAGVVAREWEGLTIGSLVPGALVTAKVRALLSDGLLVSFLTFFSGTIDPFHLGLDPGVDWKKHFSANQRVKARILYVDPASKRVGLTLAKHLLDFSLPQNFPILGQVFEDAVVRRVDDALGLLLELPAVPAGAPLTPGYAHISSIADEKVEALHKRFRPGQRVRCRVTGFRPMDGLAVLSLKPSVVDNNVVSYADVRPGMPLSGVVSKVEDFGLVVAITPSVRAVVPTLHMSDLGTKKAHKKFKDGQKVAGRVLAIDPAVRRLTLTLKPALLGSKLPPITCMQDAVPGSRSHGVVTGVQDFGVFVSFYGGVSGLAHVSECGLPHGQKPTQAFEPGQTVKCRVLAHDPAHKGLKLSLVSKKQKVDKAAVEAATDGAAGTAVMPAEQGDALAGIQAGDVVTGTVKSLETKEMDGEAVPHHLELDVNVEGGRTVRAKLDYAHLGDHSVAVHALWGALKPGVCLEGLLVLQRLEGSKSLRLSRKASLVAAAATLPRSLADVAEGAVLPGYVASVTSDAVFVRFLNSVTGRAGLAALSDTFVSDPHLHFGEGQSVRAQVVRLDRDKERFSLTLKQSLCGAPDAALLASLFRDLDLASELGAEAGERQDWAADFPIGAIVRGQVDDVKEYGVLCDIEGHPDLVGLAAPHQVPEGASSPGHSMQGVVLDVNKKHEILDLSLLPELLELAAKAAQVVADDAGGKQQQGKKKRRKTEKGAVGSGEGEGRLQLGQELDCTVQLAKEEEGYLVVTLPPCQGGEGPATPFVGFLPITDYNLAGGPKVQHTPALGNVVRARVAALPSPSSCVRLLLHLPLDHRSLKAATQPHSAQKQRRQQEAAADAAKGHHPKAGEVVSARVDAVHAVHAEVTLEGTGCRGRLHICEAAAPLAELHPGSTLQVVVLGRISSAEGRRHGVMELSSRPEVLAADGSSPLYKPLAWGSLKEGQQLEGFVQEVCGDSVWCVFSPSVRGRAFLEHAGVDEGDQDLEALFETGQPVKAHVVAVDNAKRVLEVSLVGPRHPPKAGEVVLGRVLGVDGGGVRVQIGGRSVGKAALTDLQDSWVDNVLHTAPRPGQLARAAVLGEVRGEKGHFLLSLRPSAIAGEAPSADAPPQALPPSQLKPGQQVSGYVKAVGPAGAFVCLARDCEARVRLGQLADSFVSDPQAAFPSGKRLQGRVLKVEGDRVEVTLKSGGRPAVSLEGLEEGTVVRGRVKRVEKFGVFVQLDSGVTGLAHVSEVAEEYVKDIAALFSVGQRVVARVLKVDKSASRLSLGLKPSYFADFDEGEIGGGSGEEEEGAADFDAQVEAALMSEGESDIEEELGMRRVSDGANSSSEGEEDGSGGEDAIMNEEGDPFDLDEEIAAAEEGSIDEENDDL